MWSEPGFCFYRALSPQTEWDLRSLAKRRPRPTPHPPPTRPPDRSPHVDASRATLRTLRAAFGYLSRGVRRRSAHLLPRLRASNHAQNAAEKKRHRPHPASRAGEICHTTSAGRPPPDDRRTRNRNPPLHAPRTRAATAARPTQTPAPRPTATKNHHPEIARKPHTKCARCAKL